MAFLRSVGQLPWALGVLFSDTVTALDGPWGRYFRTGFLKVWASDLLRKKPLAGGIDQSFEFQPHKKSMEAWERGHRSRSPAHLIHLSALTLMQLIVGYPCTSLAAPDTGLVKCLSMLEQTAPGRVMSSDLQSRDQLGMDSHCSANIKRSIEGRRSRDLSGSVTALHWEDGSGGS